MIMYDPLVLLAAGTVFTGLLWLLRGVVGEIAEYFKWRESRVSWVAGLIVIGVGIYLVFQFQSQLG
jgi:uncharacterized membrane protein HdeD (DUF308 family)